MGGELTVDDLVEPVPMEARTIARDCLRLNYMETHQGFDSYRYTAEKLHLALEGLLTILTKTASMKNVLIPWCHFTHLRVAK
ncbi:hypothetical protein OH492_24930 [Vibrio chagasii]|nr:hypothetical protein [Vibrio chagasii]